MDRAKIAQNLRALRGERKREEVALACGITAQAISLYEIGARVPTDEIKERLAEYFCTTVQKIFYS